MSSHTGQDRKEIILNNLSLFSDESHAQLGMKEIEQISPKLSYKENATITRYMKLLGICECIFVLLLFPDLLFRQHGLFLLLLFCLYRYKTTCLWEIIILHKIKKYYKKFQVIVPGRSSWHYNSISLRWMILVISKIYTDGDSKRTKSKHNTGKFILKENNRKQ